LAVEKQGCRFPSRAGISCLVDGQLFASAALVRLGIGMLEIGPLLFDNPTEPEFVECDLASGRIQIRHAGVRRSLAEIRNRLIAARSAGVPLFVRLRESADVERLFSSGLGTDIAQLATGFILPFGADHRDRVVLHSDAQTAVAGAVRLINERAPAAIVLFSTSGDENPLEQAAAQWSRDGMIAGVLIEPSASDRDALQSAAADLPSLLSAIPQWRIACGYDALLIARGGIHEPIDALRAVRAGADLVMLDSGLVHAGPGLPKRINDLMEFEQRRLAKADENPVNDLTARNVDRDAANRPAARAWFWLMLLGMGLLIGGGMTLSVAVSRVVLPYDEALTGLTRLQIMAINPRLLDFMRHDRITLAGTMLAVGILYLALAIKGARLGLRWAWLAVIVSAAAGYLSFFLFLGFGYFDPFHAFVTAVSFPLLLLGVHAPISSRKDDAVPDLHNDWRWRAGLWGQLLFVIQGVMIIVAGFTISYLGATRVFVPEDMEFLCTADGVLQTAHPQLVPLVAHDRASFGGMLVTCGLATLLPALWGFRCGRRWLWAALIGAGSVAYVATIAVHLAVGYTNAWHLAPAYSGFALLLLAGALSYPYLAARSSDLSASITC
jgi:hypothetical protein